MEPALPDEVWIMVFRLLVRTHGLVEYTSLLRIATTSKSFRVRAIAFWNESLSVAGETEAMVAEPARVFNPRDACASLPPIGILRPLLVSDLDEGVLPIGTGWSILRSARSACIRTSDAARDLASLARLAPAVTAVTVIFNAQNVSFGPTIVMDDGVRCLIIDRCNAARVGWEPSGPKRPVSGSIRCRGVTHFAISGRARGLPSFECIEMPNARHVLVGHAPGSFAGIERLTGLLSLAIGDTGTGQGVLPTIGNLGALRNLRKLYIGFSSIFTFVKFTSDALPSLARLVSITVCTPRGAEDMFLHRAHASRACLTGLESLGLVGLGGEGEGREGSWPAILAPVPMHTDLPRSALLKRLDIHCAWYSSWVQWRGLSSITELSLGGIRIVRDHRLPRRPPAMVASLESLGLASMLSLTVLRLNDIQHLQSLSGLLALPSSLSTLVVTKCADLTQAGCMVLGAMHSLVELSFTECGLGGHGLVPTVPSLIALTRLDTLCVDLRVDDDDEDDDDADAEIMIPEIPPSLRRLRFHSENSYQALERPQLEYMSRLAEENQRLTELSIGYWDGVWVSGFGIVPYQKAPALG